MTNRDTLKQRPWVVFIDLIKVCMLIFLTCHFLFSDIPSQIQMSTCHCRLSAVHRQHKNSAPFISATQPNTYEVTYSPLEERDIFKSKAKSLVQKSLC